MLCVRWLGRRFTSARMEFARNWAPAGMPLRKAQLMQNRGSPSIRVRVRSRARVGQPW